MVRTAVLGTLVAAICANAWADQLVLQDGRTFTGTVTVRDDKVLIEMSYGTMCVNRSEVLRIELKDTPQTEFSKRLAKVQPKDVDAMLDLALWAQTNQLNRDAQYLYARILQISPNHAGARKAAGYVRIDGQWCKFDEALEIVRSKLDSAQCDAKVLEAMPALEEIAPKEKAMVVRDLLAQAQLRARRFATASETFRELARKTGGPTSMRYAAVADILSANREGMYVLDEPYPPSSTLLATKGPSLPSGPASLADPMVLEAALRDRAKAQIKAGRDLMEAATTLESTDPDGAGTKYKLAVQAFNRADSLVDGIARSYRVEIARRQIAAIRRDADADAKKFDAVLATMAKKELPPPAYRNTIVRSMHLLNNIRGGLKSVLDIAKPYPRELVLEIGWAQQDLRLIESKRDILSAELDAKD